MEEHFKIKDLTFTVLVHAARALASRTMRGFHVYNIEKGNPNTEGHVLRRCLGVDTVDGLEVPNLDKARQLFQFIYDETGIDIIERGFRFIGHEPQILESMLSNKLEKTANRYYRNFNVSSVALRYYTAQKLEQIAAVPNLWSVGDYDDDHEAYLAMRDGDADAIQMFADRIASLVKGDAAFNDAELIVAVPGREAFGKPLDLLAVRIAEMTGKTFVDGIWQGRLQSRIASEAQISFRQKAEQAFDNYRLRSATGKVVRGLKGKTVIAIDDNYTTGATMDAVTLALINAGAVKVLRIVATRTNRY